MLSSVLRHAIVEANQDVRKVLLNQSARPLPGQRLSVTTNEWMSSAHVFPTVFECV